jgi:hypothetical protein
VSDISDIDWPALTERELDLLARYGNTPEVVDAAKAEQARRQAEVIRPPDHRPPGGTNLDKTEADSRNAHIRNLVLAAILIDMEREEYTDRILVSLEDGAGDDAVVTQEGGWLALAEAVNGVLDEVFRTIQGMQTKE